jgi:hypothetical protein
MVSAGRSGTCIFLLRGMCGYWGHAPYFHESKSEIFRNVVSYVEGWSLLETELHRYMVDSLVIRWLFFPVQSCCCRRCFAPDMAV